MKIGMGNMNEKVKEIDRGIIDGWEIMMDGWMEIRMISRLLNMENLLK
jgi:hypothetical protein